MTTDDRGKYAPGIKAALEARGWTRNQLALRMLHNGDLNRVASVYEWCEGTVQPGIKSLFAIGRALRMTTLITPEGVEYAEPETVAMPPEAD